MGKAIKRQVMIVDDHPMMRRGYSCLVQEEPDLEVCAEAGSSEDAMRLARQTNPDLVLVDISLAGASGLDLIPRLMTWKPEVKVLVASMYDASLFAERSLRCGARGYINKEEATDVVIEAIRAVLAGEIYVDSETNSRLLLSLAGGKPLAETNPVDSLSNREFEVFSLIGRGRSTREIAEKLRLSVKTIETYRENIKSKLSLHSSSAMTQRAVHWVLENG